MKSNPISSLTCVLALSLCACDCGRIDLGGEIENDTDEDGHTPPDVPWTPPIDNLGEPGWRDSTEPWCAETEKEILSFHVWSEPEGVYVLAPYRQVDLEGVCDLEHRCYNKNNIYFNGGTGWSLYYTSDNGGSENGSIQDILGIQGGPLIAIGEWNCYTSFILDGVPTCYDVYTIDPFVVNENLVYAITQGSEDFVYTKVIQFDGSGWSPVPAAYTPYIVEHLWADEENLFCSGQDGTITSLEDGEWRIHDTGTLEDFGEIWGFGENDIWAAGGETGLMHYNGEAWSPVEWPTLAENFVKGIWGVDGILFFHTNSQLAMWDGIGFTVLGYWSPTLLIFDIWGNSPEEVFLAVEDDTHSRQGCGIYYLLWWDGSAFHWF